MRRIGANYRKNASISIFKRPVFSVFAIVAFLLFSLGGDLYAKNSESHSVTGFDVVDITTPKSARSAVWNDGQWHRMAEEVKIDRPSPTLYPVAEIIEGIYGTDLVQVPTSTDDSGWVDYAEYTNYSDWSVYKDMGYSDWSTYSDKGYSDWSGYITINPFLPKELWFFVSIILFGVLVWFGWKVWQNANMFSISTYEGLITEIENKPENATAMWVVSKYCEIPFVLLWVFLETVRVELTEKTQFPK